MKHSILLVDDNRGITAPMAEYLQGAGYKVIVAHTTSEARKVLGEARLSLVITDLRMETGQDEDGLALIREIREKHPGLPVFILTASGSPDAAAESIRLQVQKFLGKPVSMPGLLATVQNFVNDFYGAVAR
jgi:DNA-binding NtrC family response regulator